MYGDDPKPMSLAGASSSKLVKTLSHPNMLWRKHAQRLLVEQDKPLVRTALERLAARRTGGRTAGVIHALATLQGLGLIEKDTDTAIDALSHKSPAVRRVAAQVLGAGSLFSRDRLSRAGAFVDPDPSVRLAAFTAAANGDDFDPIPGMPPGQTTAITTALVTGLRDPVNTHDHWILDAMTSAASQVSYMFLRRVSESDEPVSQRGLQLVETVAEHFARSESRGSASNLLANLNGGNADVVDAIVVGVSRGWPSGKKAAYNEKTERQMEALVQKLKPGTRGEFIKLVSGWGSDRFRKYADKVIADHLQQADDEQATPANRIKAAQQLVAFQPSNADAVSQLLNRIGPQTPSNIASGFIVAAGNSEASTATGLILQKMASLTPTARTAAIGSLLGRTDSTRALLNALSKGELQLGDLSLDQRQALSSHPDRSIRELARRVLAKTGGLSNPDRQKVLAEFMAVCEMKGTKDAGQAMFKKHCSKCHMHSGDGTKVGPDLTGMAVHPKKELLGHILDPSASVEGNYRLYSVVTEDGKAISGMLAAESRTTLELFDTEGKKHSILREEIDEMVSTKKSVMPEGFEKLMSKQQFADLLTFLTARGKFLPIDISKVASVASDRGMFVRREADVERLIFPDWKPKMFKNVPFVLTDPQDGTVPNTILLHGPGSPLVQRMPKRVEVPLNGPAQAIHMLSGVGGWAYPYSRNNTVSVIVRLHYGDGSTEDHELRNGEHFADYIRVENVPKSELAFKLRGQQVRYLSVNPKRTQSISRIEFIKGPDGTAPVIMAITAEAP